MKSMGNRGFVPHAKRCMTPYWTIFIQVSEDNSRARWCDSEYRPNRGRNEYTVGRWQEIRYKTRKGWGKEEAHPYIKYRRDGLDRILWIDDFIRV